MTHLSTVFIALVLLPVVSSIRVQAASEDALLTTGSFAAAPAPEKPILRFVSYNLHGPQTKRIEPMIRLLQTHERLSDAAVYAFQEVDRGHAGSGGKDNVVELARALGTYYAYAVGQNLSRGAGVRGVALLSRYPLSAVERVLLPVAGPGGRRRIALGATIQLPKGSIRVYSVHLERRISQEKREEQFRELLKHAGRFQIPTVILGDFNTSTRESRNNMFALMQEAGYACPLRVDVKTFQSGWVVRSILDWIWTRQLPVLEADVEGEVKISDHRPVWVTIDARKIE
jgi:endonuclease/exonuclease/phosphatase family metal-dependent hydrolase